MVVVRDIGAFDADSKRGMQCIDVIFAAYRWLIRSVGHGACGQQRRAMLGCGRPFHRHSARLCAATAAPARSTNIGDSRSAHHRVRPRQSPRPGFAPIPTKQNVLLDSAQPRSRKFVPARVRQIAGRAHYKQGSCGRISVPQIDQMVSREGSQQSTNTQSRPVNSSPHNSLAVKRTE